MLWVDKHRPAQLKDLSYHNVVTERLQALAKNPTTLPHLFVYGPDGAGKRTRIAALLREIFGGSAAKLKLDSRTFTTPSGRAVEINMITSPHHVELSPGDAGLNDRYVIQDVIKEMAATRNIRSSMAATAAAAGSGPVYKVVVLTQVDQLSRQAQAALRRTMEKYAATCRIILCCDSPTKLIGPLQSRCLGIRVAAPTTEEICRSLQSVARKENVTLPDPLAMSIAKESNRSMRRAILMLEATYAQARDASSSTAGGRKAPVTLAPDLAIPAADWKLYISQLAADVTREQSPQRLQVSREKLYELLVNCIPATIILKTLVQELLTNLDDSLKLEVLEWAAHYEHRLALGSSKEIFHLEAFLAKYMSIYKKYLNDLFA